MQNNLLCYGLRPLFRKKKSFLHDAGISLVKYLYGNVATEFTLFRHAFYIPLISPPQCEIFENELCNEGFFNKGSLQTKEISPWSELQEQLGPSLPSMIKTTKRRAVRDTTKIKKRISRLSHDSPLKSLSLSPCSCP